jgi:hypothetical protein
VLRLYGVSFVLACLLALGWGAAGAATPKRAVFSVTLTGTLTKDWTVQRSTVDEGECSKTTTTSGRWSFALATTRSSRITIVGPSSAGKPLRITGLLRGIRGTARQTGSTRLAHRGARCVGSPRTTACGPQTRSVGNASLRLTSPRRGIARFSPTRGAAATRSFRATCPEEPEEIRSIRTDLALADAPLDAADVFARDVPRFFITGNTVQDTTIEGEYDGKVTERVRWTLTFTRLR